MGSRIFCFLVTKAATVNVILEDTAMVDILVAAFPQCLGSH